MTKRRLYLQNAALLTASGLVLRVLGMGFRVVLSAYLGGEGMGLYQLILALYMVFVSLATAGINVAATRLAAQSLARGQGMGATLRGLCTTALGFGTAAMVAQALLAGPAARRLLHDARAETALRILARLQSEGIVSEREAHLMAAALAPQAVPLPLSLKDALCAGTLRSMILELAKRRKEA